MKSVAWLYGLPYYKQAQNTLLFLCASMVTDWTICFAHTLFFKGPFLYSDEQTNLITQANKQKLDVPILFIHAHDDTCVAIDVVQQFAQQIEHTDSWWIDTSKHACNHLKYTAEYMDRVHTFIDTVLQKRS
jgi:pimeloyl-ACP methyl ester carboxylesterase